MMPNTCRRGLEHDFDPVSGWCLGGCGWRDDGRSQYYPTQAHLDHIDITEPRRAAERTA